MNRKWKNKIVILVVNAILLSLLPFGGIAASTPSSETSLTSKLPNRSDTLAFASGNNQIHSQKINTVSTTTYDNVSPQMADYTGNELIEKRTRNSKVFLNNDGTTTVQTSVYSLNYYDGQGWQEIDTSIRSDHADPNYTHSMLTNNFKVKLHNKGNKQAVTFSVYDQSVTYRAIGVSDVTGTVSGNTITYSNAWQSTDLQYQIMNDQLKMELHLADNNAPRTFTFEVLTKGVKHRVNADGSIDFVDKSGIVKFKIPQMWIQDASNDAKRYDRLNVEVRQEGNKSVIGMTLDDKGLQYPIVIDPTTEIIFNTISNGGMIYLYDLSGRLSKIALPTGDVIDFIYDANGNLLRKTKSKSLLNKWISGHGTGSNQQFLADVNGDGKADSIVYFGSDGSWYAALSNGSGFNGYTRWITGHGTGSSQQFLGDVNGDGKADSVVYFDSDGSWYAALSNGSGFNGYTRWISGHGIGSNQQFLADVNGDGKADSIVYFGSDGSWYAALSNGSGFNGYTRWITGHGTGSNQQFLADVNGDGKADSIVYFDSDGSWYAALSNGNGFNSYTRWISGHGIGSNQQFLADVSGDGKADSIVYFDGDGSWYAALSNGNGFNGFARWQYWFGAGSANQIIRDVTGDGKADFVSFYNSNGSWYIIPSIGH